MDKIMGSSRPKKRVLVCLLLIKWVLAECMHEIQFRAVPA